MLWTWLDEAALKIAAERATGERPPTVTVSARALSGGLESAGVAELTLRYVDSLGRRRVVRIVAKRLEGPSGRELAVYETVVAAHAAKLAPRLLHAAKDARGVTLLLEAVRPERRWPWRNVALAALPLEGVAALHAAADPGVVLPEWDYDGELEERASWAVEWLARLPRNHPLQPLRPFFPAVRRIGSQLRAVRRQLASGSLPRAVIHGDLHPGNALVRRTTVGDRRIALLDWGRVRIGSPLEDVSSWLTSVCRWEPVARQRHDSLLGVYLAARGHSATPTRALRESYWLAGACNAFSGALLHHVEHVTDTAAAPAARDSAARSARDWLRVIRRADAVWSECPRAATGAPGRRTSTPAPHPAPTPPE